MAHYQETEYDRFRTGPKPSPSNGRNKSFSPPWIGEDEIGSEAYEPSDNRISFKRRATTDNASSTHGAGNTTPPFLDDRRASLLTRGLLSGLSMTTASDTELPALSSDGSITSPTRTNTPSPPLPPCTHTGLAGSVQKGVKSNCDRNKSATSEIPAVNETVGQSQDITPEAGLRRKRCITFACGRQTSPQSKAGEVPIEKASKPADAPRRPCVLRFVCPMKPSTKAIRSVKTDESPPRNSPDTPAASQPTAKLSIPGSQHRPHRDSLSTVKDSLTRLIPNSPLCSRSRSSEATRFHEFAGPFLADDDWTHKPTAYRVKMTISDTLRKENAIRRLGEEAEEEALEEDAEEEVPSDDNLDEVDDEDLDSDNEDSDGGNESDDEEGFADSDDESECGSQYQFWTPGLTTAATSTDHVEQIRPSMQRIASDSSIESVVIDKEQSNGSSISRIRKGLRHRKPPRMRPGTPDLPDSTDFVCGTLDEDRPLEAAYMSCLEERRRSRHRLMPQDIDPSFPTSASDQDNTDEDDAATQASEEALWVAGRPDNSDDGEHSASWKKSVSGRTVRSPMPTPKRLRSPAPPRRTTVHRSPPPHRLFGLSPHRTWSPVLSNNKATSPPSTRRTSLCASPPQRNHGSNMPRLAQRPHLTHTTSLPRTPNPFWGRHHLESRCASRAGGIRTRGPHSRGPIDIVKGIQHRRQRRKETMGRQHCRTVGKDSERRCQPGKGAERMRELGLEMAGKGRGYGQKPGVVLSA